MLCALIMAGGKGTRFWPLSTEEKPKQFLNLIGEDTMIQMTVNRIKPIIPMERIFVCTGARYVSLVREQLPELPERNIIIEPEGRNTAPCITLSAMIINRIYKDANMVVLPSDHLIKNEEKFRELVLVANTYIERNKDALVTLGIKVTRPESGYGYIKICEKNFQLDQNRILKVENFKEKPDEETALTYLQSGKYLWNAGMFIWNAKNIINKIKEYSSITYRTLRKIEKLKEEEIQEYVNNNYLYTEAISIDYAVLEKCRDIYVIPCDISWDDIGTWQSVERYKIKDCNNNIITNNVTVIESSSNMTINNEKKVVMIGVEDIMTLETQDTIYIINKDYIDNLKDYKNII